MHTISHRLGWLLCALTVLAGCATNPVTGEKELKLVSEGQELQIGTQNYAPMQQTEGGPYDLDPELVAYVRGVGNRLAAVSDRPLPYEFAVINNSIPNAWALPGGKIAINRGLLTELRSESELAAVLAHEIVHAAAGHSAQAMQRGMLLQGAIIATAVAANDSDYANIAVAGANIAAQLISQRYGREAELESDEYGMRYMSRAGFDPQGAVDLQETFVRLNEGQRTDWLSGLFASHPPSHERVAANRQTASTLPPGGDPGRERFGAAMQRTLAAKPAYDAYDKGRRALAERQPRVALAEADKALGLEPREAHFHALRGDARFLQKDYARAIASYGAALSHRDNFFYYHLQRGLARERLRDDAGAKRDLENSIKLLPTGPAHFALGNIAARNRQYDVAKKHYQIAASSQGELGLSAQTSLLRLDLPDNPERYLQKQAGLDGEGQLVVQIGNPTKVPVTDIRLGVRFVDAGGRVREMVRELQGKLSGGQTSQIPTGLGPFTDARQFQVVILSARVAE